MTMSLLTQVGSRVEGGMDGRPGILFTCPLRGPRFDQ
jgi:hypothetical protein